MAVHWQYWELESAHGIDDLALNRCSEPDLLYEGNGDPFGDSPVGYWTGNASSAGGQDGDRHASIKRVNQSDKALFDSFLWPNAGRLVLAFEYNAVGLVPPGISKTIIFCGDRNLATGNLHGIKIVHAVRDKFSVVAAGEIGGGARMSFPSDAETFKTITDWHNAHGRMGVFVDVDFPSRTLAAHIYTLGDGPVKQSALPRTMATLGSLGPLAAASNVAQLSIGHLPSRFAAGPGSNALHASIRRLHVINFGALHADASPDRRGIPDNLADLFERIAADEMTLSSDHLALAGLINPVRKAARIRVRRYRIRVRRR